MDAISSVAQWVNLPGTKATYFLCSLRDKASQWWYFLGYPEVQGKRIMSTRRLYSQ
jgi:transposase